MAYRVRKKDNRWFILDDNDEVAGSFKTRDAALKLVESMTKVVKPAKKVKKTKNRKKKNDRRKTILDS
tara:strand:+ start:1353 stop:1556 length:204 start_codon:yes stop_codon:yes gene_type:complete